MKKFNVVFLSLLAIVFGGILCACNFKKVEVKFTENEIVLSQQETIDMEDFIEVVATEKSQVSYRFSNPQMFEVQGSKITTKGISGRSFVYAIYQNNSLASMQLVVKKPFDAPSNFVMDEDGLITWTKVESVFESQLGAANTYKIEGQHISISDSGKETITTISETISENSYRLANGNGIYKLKFTALGNGYFDDSVASEQVFYLGYMPKLAVADFSWNDGKVSWSPVAGAKYSVRFDNMTIATGLETASFDLTQRLENTSVGTHNVSVVVSDASAAEGRKFDTESERVIITKLAVPTVSLQEGQIAISSQTGAEMFDVVLTSESGKTTELKKLAGTTNFEEEIDAGLYQLSIRAAGNIVENGERTFLFHGGNVTYSVYKLETPDLEGAGNNPVNGTTFNLSLKNAAAYNAKLVVYENDAQIGEFSVDALQVFSEPLPVNLSEAGKHQLTARFFPVAANSDVFVLNSDYIKPLTVTKMGAFEQDNPITHSYDPETGNSVFIFKKVQEAPVAQNYEFASSNSLVDGEVLTYEILESGDYISVLLGQRVEKMFLADENGKFNFEVTTKLGDDDVVINSSAQKVLTVLEAPRGLTSEMNSTNNVLSWQTVANTEKYLLTIYSLTAQEYLASLENPTFQPTSAPIFDDVVLGTQHLLQEGYYHIQLRAYAEEEKANELLTSVDFLSETFYVSKQLEMKDVQFGYDESLPNEQGQTNASGFFFKLSSGEDVDFYEIRIDNSSIEKVKTGDSTIALLGEDFDAEKEYSIRVIAHANDETIYKPSVAWILSVERLACITENDYAPTNPTSRLKIDDFKPNQMVTVEKTTGVRDVEIIQTDDMLKFKLFGSVLDPQTNLYESGDGKIYLDSKQSSIVYARLAAPTNLQYYDGKLKFVHTEIADIRFYVLDILCTTNNEGETISFSVRLDNEVTAFVNDTSVVLGEQSKFFEVVGATFNEGQINIDAIIECLKSDTQLSGIYNQAKEISFSVYAYQTRYVSDRFVLSSPYAKTIENKLALNLKKLPSVSLDFNQQTGQLSWNEVEVESSYAAETTYEVHMIDASGKETIVSATTPYFVNVDNASFYVKVTNPYFLQSSSSNLVKIRRLNALSYVSLTSDGKLSFKVSDIDMQHCDTVLLSIDGADAIEISLTNGVGSCNISGAGTYAFTLVGTSVVDSNGTKSFYLSSNTTSWTLKNMSTLAPANDQLTVVDNEISWDGLDASAAINGLEYILIFKDKDGSTEIFKTTQTSVNWLEETKLGSVLKNLAEGDVQIQLSAHILPHEIANGGTIYFASQTTLLDGSAEFNHLIYTEKTIKKLSTPKLVELVFENPTSTSTNPNTQTPTIKLTIEGNYGNSATFQIFRQGDEINPIATKEVVADGNGNFVITLQVEDYNNYISAGNDLAFSIYAISRGENASAIPSAEGKIVITRAHDLKGLSFAVQDGQAGFTQDVQIAYDTLAGTTGSSEIIGGIALKITLTDALGVETTLHKTIATTGAFEESVAGLVTYDLSEILRAYLPHGGTVALEAYIISHSNGNSHILASNVFTSETYIVLSGIEQVTPKDFGFEIADTNDVSVTYIVASDKGKTQVTADENGKYLFTLPNDWEDGQHNVTIYAVKDECVASVKKEISFTLSRIDSVQNVRLTRGTDLLATISWDAVKETESKLADGYVVNVFLRNGTTKGVQLGAFEIEQNFFRPVDLFGANYENLTTSILTQDTDILIEITTKGGSKNNSYAYSIFASIKGNNTSENNLIVDEFGNIVFEKGGSEFLYRFVSGNGSDELSNWTKMTSNVLDTSILELDGAPFNVEVITMGTEQATSTDTSFVLDSQIYSTATLSTDPTYFKIDGLISLDIDPSVEGGLTFTLPTRDFTCLYAGFSVDAILKASEKQGENLIAINPTYVGRGNENNQYLFTYPLADLLSALAENLASGEKTLYFWIYKQSDEESASKYVVSDAYQFTFHLQQTPQFEAIYNGKYVTDKNVEVSDFVNTYVTFANNDTLTNITVGIFVKISWGESSAIRFITKDALQENSDKFNSYSINLMKLIEEDEILNAIEGEFVADFARASIIVDGIAADGISYTYSLSNWLSSTETGALEMYRLEKVPALELVDGNLTWENVGQLATKYYVYFFTDVEANAFTYVATATAAQNTFNVSDYVGTDSKYYLAVQAIDETKTTTLASSKVFKMNGSDLQVVYKNQINSPVKLKNGTLYIDWTLGDFYTMLTQPTDDFSALAKELVSQDAIFTSPFTFTLQDLIDGNIFVRMRFTPLANGGALVGRTFDVNAMNLLASLVEFGNENSFNISERLSALYDYSENLTVSERRLLDRLRQAVENGSFGVANHKNLFDNIFESLQMGQYSLEYCLVTEGSTMNSQWYSYSNANNENVIYVNAEPVVNVITLAKGDGVNEFKVIIEQSSIYNYNGDGYGTETAEKFVLKLGNAAFTIYNDGGSYKLMQLDVDNPVVIPVYTCGADGNETGADTGYLMFYLNHNNGQSLLSIFDSLEKGAQEMQIYAVGNDCSISSKSRYFNITFLNFDSFNVVEGTFIWSTYYNRETTVLVKANRSNVWEECPPVDGSYETATFSLDGKAGGVYSLRFIMEGDVVGNSIIVDSPIYHVEHVYKLEAPTLENIKGNLAIDVDKATKDNMPLAYSDNALFRFMITNDAANGRTRTFAGNENGETYLYEVGTTNMTSSDSDFAYKNTEESANNFEVTMLGSTATLQANPNAESGHIKNVVCIDAYGNETDKGIALRSAKASINASMLSSVETGSLIVEDGIVKWDAVSGRLNPQTNEFAAIEDGFDVVYKVTISRYRNSDSASGIAITKVTEDLIFYTAKTEIDLAILKEDPEIEKYNPLIGVTVQALAMQIEQSSVDSNRVNLVEGGFGVGNARFEGSETWRVLMSNGSILRGIDRFAPAEQLDVIDGKLTWLFTSDNAAVTAANFKEYYDFVVTDDEAKRIGGTFEVSKLGNMFEVVFTEDAGQMKVGKYEVSVYVSQGTRNFANTIKSFGRSLEIEKLATLTANDYVIISSGLEDGQNLSTEILSLEEYFQANPNNIVEINLTAFDGQIQTYTFTKLKNKLYILKEELADGQVLRYGDEFVTDENGKGYVVVNENAVQLTFKVSSTITDEKIIFSDVSQQFALHRTEWKNHSITWDEQAQKFTWDFDLNSFNNNVTAVRMRFANILTTATSLQNADGEDVLTLNAGTEIEVLDEGEDGKVMIYYDNQTYYIARNSYEGRWMEVTDQQGNVQMEVLDVGKLFRILEENETDCIIELDEETEWRMFKVSSSSIVKPIYIVKATYTNDRGQSEVRTYTTKDNQFFPTIVGKVQISVSIKVNDVNLLSEEKQSQEASFNLFASGSGTAQNPYVITNKNQFANIAYRMTKDAALNSYSANATTINEETKFYFSLQNNITLDYFKGVMFAGEFDGVIDGNNNQITFISTGVDQLSSNIVISETAIYLSENANLTYSYGTALFERFSATSNIKNLKIDATFGDGNSVRIRQHSLMSGLVITNNGRIENVVVTKFTNHFYGDFYDSAYRALMAYSGLVSVNNSSAIISNCQVLCDITILDAASPQVISLAGIAYHNYGTIERCVAGTTSSSILIGCDDGRASVQVAGIVATNATNSAIVTNCENNFSIKVVNWDFADITCFMAGIVVLDKGNATGTNNGGLPTYEGNVNATVGSIVAKKA